MTCRAQHLGPYIEGQGHSATLQQNRVRPITLLFEVGFRKYFREMVTILRQRVTQHMGHYLEGQGHSMTLRRNHVRPIICYLKSDFENISQKRSPY